MSKRLLKTQFNKRLKDINIDPRTYVAPNGSLREYACESRNGFWIAWDISGFEPGQQTFDVVRGITYALPPALINFLHRDDPNISVFSSNELSRCLTTDICTQLEGNQVLDALSSVALVEVVPPDIESVKHHRTTNRALIG